VAKRKKLLLLLKPLLLLLKPLLLLLKKRSNSSSHVKKPA
jgi:hypothetical protein